MQYFLISLEVLSIQFSILAPWVHCYLHGVELFFIFHAHVFGLFCDFFSEQVLRQQCVRYQEYF